MGEVFSLSIFIFGAKYIVAKRQTLDLHNVLLGLVLLATWRTRESDRVIDGGGQM